MKQTTLLLVLVTLTSLSSSAQTKFGITAGATFANSKAKFENLSVTSDIKPGFAVGVFSDIPMGGNFSFVPALNFVQKGWKSEDESFSGNGTSTVTTNLNYLEANLNCIYTTGKSKGFFVGGGHTLSYGISGKSKYVDDADPGNPEEEKIKFGSDNDQMKPFEIGANFLAGYKFAKGFMLTGNYNLGLTSLVNGDKDENGSLKNRYFSFKIGYLF